MLIETIFKKEKLRKKKLQVFKKKKEEILSEQTIKATEQKALDRVFKLFSGKNSYFTSLDIKRVMKLLDYNLPNNKIDLMIWVFFLINLIIRRLITIQINKQIRKSSNLCIKEIFMTKMARNLNHCFMLCNFLCFVKKIDIR